MIYNLAVLEKKSSDISRVKLNQGLHVVLDMGLEMFKFVGVDVFFKFCSNRMSNKSISRKA